MYLRKQPLETYILSIIYGLVFFYFLFQPAIFSPDTYGYLNAMPERSAGYVIFSKFFQFLFPQNFGHVIVGAQLILGLFAVHIFLKRMCQFLNLNYILKSILLIALIFPFFPPLLVANNICSEGLSYPFYLLFLVMGFEFLYNEKKYTLAALLIIYLLLVLTRGQFIITSVIFAVVYFIKYRNVLFKKPYFYKFLLLLLVPLLATLADKTYHKLKDGMFISTPFTFVSMSGAAFYVAKEQDENYIENEEYRTVFKECYNHLDAQKLLLTSKKRNGIAEDYQNFHDHVPQICNQTVHDFSRAYYYNQFIRINSNEKAASVLSTVQSELFSKSMFFILVKYNFKDWSLLYYSNILHGFKSVFILIFVILVFLFSSFKLMISKNIYHQILFVCSALMLSNAMIVSLASHSIMRYLFYNYILLLFMLILLFKLITNAKHY